MIKKYILICALASFSILSKAQKADTVAEKIDRIFFAKVEIPPVCKEGYLYEFIDKNFAPPGNLKDGFDGEVVTNLSIDSIGNLNNIQLLENISPEIDQETIRVLSSIKWRPAINNFQHINYNLVIRMKLHNTSEEGFTITTYSDYHPQSASLKNDADTSKMLAVPDVLPIFPGGLESFIQYINKNIIYPQDAKRNKIQGKVYTSFIVEKDGSIGDIYIIRSPDEELSLEALRVLKNCPKFTPGSKNGKPVRTGFNLPIDFTLTKSN